MKEYLTLGLTILFLLLYFYGYTTYSTALALIVLITSFKSVALFIFQRTFGVPIPKMFFSHGCIVIKTSKTYKLIAGIEVKSVYSQVENLHEFEILHKCRMFLDIMTHEVHIIISRSKRIRYFILFVVKGLYLEKLREELITKLRTLIKTLTVMGVEVDFIECPYEIYANINIRKAKQRLYIPLAILLLSVILINSHNTLEVLMGLYLILILIVVIILKLRNDCIEIDDKVLILNNTQFPYSYPSPAEIKDSCIYAHHLFNSLNDYVIIVKLKPFKNHDFLNEPKYFYDIEKGRAALRRMRERKERLFLVNIIAFFKDEKSMKTFKAYMHRLGYEMKFPLILPHNILS